MISTFLQPLNTEVNQKVKDINFLNCFELVVFAEVPRKSMERPTLILCPAITKLPDLVVAISLYKSMANPKWASDKYLKFAELEVALNKEMLSNTTRECRSNCLDIFMFVTITVITDYNCLLY